VEMNRNGFCRVNLKSARFDRLCNLAMTRLAEGFCQDLALWRLKKGPPPRQQDAWKRIREVKQIAANKLILKILERLYGRSPFPFQTLNFPVGSQQPLHSDALHFHTYPLGYMCGV
jgi:hypothetical protein